MDQMVKKLKLFLIISCSLLFLFSTQTQAQQKGKGSKRPPKPVTVSSVEIKLISRTENLTSTIKPFKKIILSIEAAGRIIKINKYNGELVKNGEILALVSNPTIKSQYKNAKGSFKESLIKEKQLKKRWERTKSLSKKNISSAQLLDDDYANYSLQKIDVERKKSEVNKLKKIVESFKIKAPFDGQIINSKIELGQWVTPSNNLYHLANFQILEMELGVPGRLSGKVILNQKVEVMVKEPGFYLKGFIKAASSHVEESTGNFLVRIIIQNPKNLHVSGLLAEVKLPIGVAQMRMLIPRDAIVRKSKKVLVVKVENNITKILPVKVIGNYKGKVIIEAKGLKKDDLVVTRGNERLFPGMKVKATFKNKF